MRAVRSQTCANHSVRCCSRSVLAAWISGKSRRIVKSTSARAARCADARPEAEVPDRLTTARALPTIAPARVWCRRIHVALALRQYHEAHARVVGTRCGNSSLHRNSRRRPRPRARRRCASTRLPAPCAAAQARLRVDEYRPSARRPSPVPARPRAELVTAVLAA